MFSVNIDAVTNQPMAWTDPVFDGGSPIRRVDSWEHLNSVALSNNFEPNNIKIIPEIRIELEKRWGSQI